MKCMLFLVSAQVFAPTVVANTVSKSIILYVKLSMQHIKSCYPVET